MPYVLRDGSNQVITVMLNPIDINTEFLQDSDDEIQLFHFRRQKHKEICYEFDIRKLSVTVNNVEYPLQGEMYQNLLYRILKAKADSVPTVYCPDVNGLLNPLSISIAENLAEDLESYTNDLKNAHSYKMSLVESASTLVELQAVSTTTGWPAPPS